MKKNISINISGIIFHIEEDGYATLKEYLDSISKYFSTYEDSAEIITDIESRIAEIFLSKLDDGKQIISHDDVSGLIETMGTIADFEAIEEDTMEAKAEPHEEQQKTDAPDAPGKKKLFRDEKRKVIGGVAAGIAYYFSIDPLWIRLITVLMFFNIFIGAFSGIIFIAYLVLWIVVPGSTALGDDEDVKKMYRDPDKAVMGGVASGISAYFGVDVVIIRLLFVISILLGGTGLILYFILWMITPEAKSITQKMQMQGEPVTLSNIEHSIKSSLRQKDGEESAVATVLLFPFRIIAAVFGAIGNLLGPFSKFLVDGLRIVAGIFVSGVGLISMICILLATGVIFGIFTGTGDFIRIHDLPIDTLSGSFPGITYLAAFLVCVIPFLVMTLLGISILAKRMVITPALGWSIFGIWVVGMIVLAFSIPSVISSFRSEGQYRDTKTYDFGKNEVYLRLNDISEDVYEMTDLRLRGHEDSVFKLVVNYQARGRNRQQAIQNAKMIVYQVSRSGNDLIFDSNFTFAEDAIFRNQALDMTLYIPYGAVFYMEADLKEIINNTIHRAGYRVWDMEDNQWVIERSGLNCLTCSTKPRRSRDGFRQRDKSRERDSSVRRSRKSDQSSMVFDMSGFTKIDAKGIYNIYIEQRDEFEVEIKGHSRYRDDVVVRQYRDVLEIDFTRSDWEMLKDFQDKYRPDIYIKMPDIERLSGTGLCHFEIDYLEVDEFELNLKGGSSADIEIDANELKVILKGASTAEFIGGADFLEVKVSGASTLRAYSLDVANAEIRATGASSVRVTVRDRLSATTSGMSSLRYKGTPDLDINDEDGLSSIRKSRN